MTLPACLQKLRLPVIASPLFIISVPQLVIAQCKAGIVGAMPALNARPAALSGAIASGQAILAAQAMGADLAYIGSAFIATEEARADQAYKRMIVESDSDDIVYSNLFTGVHGNYLKPSIVAAGMDPDNLPVSEPSAMNFGSTRKPWKDIWGCGQGIGAVQAVEPVGTRVARMAQEYAQGMRALVRAQAVAV